MKRVTSLVAGFLLFVGVAACVVNSSLKQAALYRARTLYNHRIIAEHWLNQDPPQGRFLIWLGDSTIWEGPTSYQYPTLLKPRLWKTMGVASRVYALPGYNVFVYYCMVGGVLDQGPAALALVLNFRLLNPIGHEFNDLVSLLPTEELPHALMLPLYAQGISAPRLLLERLLRFRAIETSFFELEGAQSLLQDKWKGSDAAEPQRRPAIPAAAAMAKLLALYNVDLSPRTPVVRLLARTVRMATDRGVPVLAIVTPVPWQMMQGAGLYDARQFQRRIGVLRSAVEGAGGVLLDLHDALSWQNFALGEHFNAKGAARMADLVEPHVEQILRERPTTAHR